jgi:transcriptional regulator with XRE-family HTH domain
MYRSVSIKSLSLPGNLIRTIRETLNLSQGDLAVLLQIKQCSLSLIEAGKRKYHVTPAVVADMPKNYQPLSNFLLVQGVQHLLTRPGACGVLPVNVLAEHWQDIVKETTQDIKTKWLNSGIANGAKV